MGCRHVRYALAIAALAALGTPAHCAPTFDAAAFWSMDAIRKAPLDVEVISTKVDNGYRVDEMYFTSEMTPEGPTRVFCPYARPEAPKAPVPVVLWLHPGGGHGDAALALWLAQTFRCVVLNLDWSGQWVKGPKEFTKWRGPGSNMYADQYNVSSGLKNVSLYHIVIACRRALDFASQQPNVDMTRICVVGGSWGSYLANLLAGVDSRVKYAFCGAGAGGFHEDSHSSIATGVNALAPDLRRQWIAAFDPASYASQVTASIFQEAYTNDWFFWLGDVLADYHALAGEKRLLIRPNSNHGIGGRDIPSALFAWPQYCLWGEKPFLDVAAGSLRADGRRYAWRVKGGEAASATLYFSLGKACWPARYWIALGARKSGDHWIADLPSEMAGLAAEVFVSVFDAEGRPVSSEPVSREGVDPATTPGPLWPDGAIWDKRSGADAWRPVGPSAHSGPFKPKIETLPGGALSLGPTGDDKSFTVVTNSVILASGQAAAHKGLRLVVNGNGQAGNLKVILQRDSNSMREVACVDEVKYPATGSATIDLPWNDFIGPAGSPKEPYPFDGLRLEGERPAGSSITIESLEFLD